MLINISDKCLWLVKNIIYNDELKYDKWIWPKNTKNYSEQIQLICRFRDLKQS